MLVLACATLLVWTGLVLGHGRFWQGGPVLRPVAAGSGRAWPPVSVVVPARDEAEHVAACLRSLLAQDYPGRFRIVLVDDRSTDGTGAIARGLGAGFAALMATEHPDLAARLLLWMPSGQANVPLWLNVASRVPNLKRYVYRNKLARRATIRARFEAPGAFVDVSGQDEL